VNLISLADALDALSTSLGEAGAVECLRVALAKGEIRSIAKQFSVQADLSHVAWPQSGENRDLPVQFWGHNWRAKGEWEQDFADDRRKRVVRYKADWRMNELAFVQDIPGWPPRQNVVRAVGICLDRDSFAELCRKVGIIPKRPGNLGELAVWIGKWSKANSKEAWQAYCKSNPLNREKREIFMAEWKAQGRVPRGGVGRFS
jgi:hypothetical protein